MVLKYIAEQVNNNNSNVNVSTYLLNFFMLSKLKINELLFFAGEKDY